MIKSMKRCLKKTIGGARLTYDELLTVVSEVEMILNYQPLSCISSQDIKEPFTPSHLMIGRRVLPLPDLPSDPDNGTKEDLSRRMKHFNQTLNHFWKRWRNGYLIELRECHCYQEGSTSVTDVISRAKY